MAFLAITMMRDWKNFMNLHGGIEARVNLREEIWLTIVVSKFRPPIDLTIPFFCYQLQITISGFQLNIKILIFKSSLKQQLQAKKSAPCKSTLPLRMEGSCARCQALLFRNLLWPRRPVPTWNHQTMEQPQTQIPLPWVPHKSSHMYEKKVDVGYTRFASSSQVSKRCVEACKVASKAFRWNVLFSLMHRQCLFLCPVWVASLRIRAYARGLSTPIMPSQD